MAEFVFDRVDNIVGKEENASDQHYLLSRKSFQSLSFSGSLKVGIVLKYSQNSKVSFTCICLSHLFISCLDLMMNVAKSKCHGLPVMIIQNLDNYFRKSIPSIHVYCTVSHSCKL